MGRSSVLAISDRNSASILRGRRRRLKSEYPLRIYVTITDRGTVAGPEVMGHSNDVLWCSQKCTDQLDRAIRPGVSDFSNVKITRRKDYYGVL
jgi:hypothetical protein